MVQGDLISRSALWTDIMMIPHNGDIIFSSDVEEAVKDAPAIDAVPVVHARWTEGTTRIGMWRKCSVCGVEQTERDDLNRLSIQERTEASEDEEKNIQDVRLPQMRGPA